MEQYETCIRKADEIPRVSIEKLNIRGNDTRYIAVVEEGTNYTVGVGTNKYQLVQHRDVYETVEALGEYNIANTKLYKNGSRMCIEIEGVDTPPVEVLKLDEVKPMARIMNSYDGSLSVAVCSFGIRKVCTNGMVAPVGTSWVSSNVHLGNNIDLNKLQNNITLAFGLWDKSKDVIGRSNDFKIDSEVALFYINFPQRYRKMALPNLKREDTIYNIWNEVTRIVSHELPKLKIAGRMEHQKKANKLFNIMNVDQKTVNRISRELKEYNERNVKP